LWIYKQENITETPEATIVNQSHRLTNVQIQELLAQCNTTKDEPERNWASMHKNIEKRGVKCHYAPNTVTPRPVVYYFFGHLHREFGKICEHFNEAGILLMYKQYSSYVAFIAVSKINREIIREAENLKTIVFSMSDPKITSIFIGWALFLGVASLSFFLEIAFPAKRILRAVGNKL